MVIELEILSRLPEIQPGTAYGSLQEAVKGQKAVSNQAQEVLKVAAVHHDHCRDHHQVGGAIHPQPGGIHGIHRFAVIVQHPSPLLSHNQHLDGYKVLTWHAAFLLKTKYALSSYTNNITNFNNPPKNPIYIRFRGFCLSVVAKFPKTSPGHRQRRLLQSCKVWELLYRCGRNIYTRVYAGAREQ